MRRCTLPVGGGHVRHGVRERFEKLPFAIEGRAESGWILMDYGDVVAHLFLETQRGYYDLETLWQEANVLLSIQ